MAIFCMNCGNQVPDDSKFCPRCGQSPRGTAPATPNQDAAPGYSQPVVNTGPTYGNAYQGTPPQYTNPGYPASPQPPQQGAPQYAQNPQYPQYPQNPQYPQSPQGTPFAPGVPPVQAAKKNRLPLYIVAAIVVVIAIVGAVTYFNFINNQSSPGKTLSAFCNDLQTGDYSSAYNLLSSKFQKSATQAQWDTGLTAVFKLKKGISSCTTSNVTAASTTATGSMLLNYGDNTKETDKVSLIDENGTWKVDTLAVQS